MQKLIYICSPLKGDIPGNILQGAEYCFAVAHCGDVPIAPHVYFTRFLRDTIPQERELGLDMGLTLLHRCDQLAVFLKNGISEGMWGEINTAKKADMPIEYYKDEREYMERNPKVMEQICFVSTGRCTGCRPDATYKCRRSCIGCEKLARFLDLLKGCDTVERNEYCEKSR